MDLSQLTLSGIASHLATFLLGVAIGCGGTYFGNKYTDKRRHSEARQATRKLFRKLKDAMPTLFQEMREDAIKPEFSAVREFFVLETPGIVIGGFGPQKLRFRYYQSEHQQLRENIDLLVEAGFATDFTPGNAPLYRMSEEFIELLRGSK